MKNLLDFVERYGFENICLNTGDFISSICEYMARDMEYYRMLTQSNILNNFIWRLVNVYYEKLVDRVLIIRPDINRTDAEVYIIYITSGAKTAILSWLNGEIKCSPEEIGERLGKLIMLSQTYIEK